MKTFLITFLKLFVATDALGTLPVYIGLTEGMDETEKRKTVRLSVVTSLVIITTFVIAGRWLLDVLSIAVCDFQIAGGLLLLILAIDIMKRDEQQKADIMSSQRIGVVPLGTPLIAGPCVLTLSLVLANTVGPACTLIGAVANVLVAGAVFIKAGRITGVVGQTASKAFAKVSSLLLAGLAVTMIRKGIITAVKQAME